MLFIEYDDSGSGGGCRFALTGTMCVEMVKDLIYGFEKNCQIQNQRLKKNSKIFTVN